MNKQIRTRSEISTNTGGVQNTDLENISHGRPENKTSTVLDRRKRPFENNDIFRYVRQRRKHQLVFCNGRTICLSQCPVDKDEFYSGLEIQTKINNFL